MYIVHAIAVLFPQIRVGALIVRYSNGALSLTHMSTKKMKSKPLDLTKNNFPVASLDHVYDVALAGVRPGSSGQN